MKLSRRSLLKLAGLPPLAKIVGVQIARAEDRQFRHALTLFDDIKYGPGFENFDYVNPSAPKGGRARFGVVGSFDSLNPYTFKGETGPGAMNETLLTSCWTSLRPNTDSSRHKSGIRRTGRWWSTNCGRGRAFTTASR
jgi:microcin C transport system substrate-binding protein